MNNVLKYLFAKCIWSAITVALLHCSCTTSAQPITILPPLPASESSKQFTVTENDSTIYDVNLAVAKDGLPLYFFRNVFTPVCYTEVCKPVRIDLYWDLLGNYLGFQVPSHQPLTKTDHKEFETNDYEQLHKILLNTQSILQHFNIYELVDRRTYDLSDSVDAITGATPKTIKNEVIGGAVYTCFTLWHIANGPVKQALNDITGTHWNKALLRAFLSSTNHHYQYRAIDEVVNTKETLNNFHAQVLDIITGPNIFTARYALDKLPTELFDTSDTLQLWLWSVYKQGNYTMQSAVLEKLKKIKLSGEFALSLAAELRNANEAQFLKIVTLLTNCQTLSEDAVFELAGLLDSLEPQRSSLIYEALRERNISNASVEKKIKRFKKSSQRSN